MRRLAYLFLGIGIAGFIDHIASYYLLQWSTELTRFPTVDERAAVAQALTMDRIVFAAIWLALATSLTLWATAVLRRERWQPLSVLATWVAGGAAIHAIARVLLEAPLMVHTVRVPATGLDWHGPGFALAALALLLATLLVSQPSRRVARAAPINYRRR